MDLAGVRILVTGGSGYLGRHLLRALSSRRAVPISYSRRLVAGGVIGGVADLDALTAAMEGACAVVHLAASPGYRAEGDPIGDAEVNILGTLNVLRAAAAHGVGHVVYASSAHVYGSVPTAVSEDAPLRPSSLYGASKAAGELYVNAFNAAGRLTATVLRFSTLFGIPAAGETPPNVIQVFAQRAIAGMPLLLRGAPDRLLDLLEVGEAAGAIVLALERGAGQTYNIGSGRAVTLRETADTVVSSLGSSSEIQAGPADGASPPVLDVRKAERELGFRPTPDPRPEISRFAEWCRRGTSQPPDNGPRTVERHSDHV